MELRTRSAHFLHVWPNPIPPKPPVLWPDNTRAQPLFSSAAPNSFRHGRSAVSISSLASGALGEHRRHYTHGIN